MNADDYLKRLHKELKHLPAEQQTNVLEEVAAHLAEGQADERLGQDPDSREQRLSAEMGAPEDLGRRMKDIHKPNRWPDYAMIVAPEVLLLPWIGGLMALLLPNQVDGAGIFAWPGLVWGIRLTIMLEAALLGLAVWRERRGGSPGVTLYWLASAWLLIFGLTLREKRWIADSYFHGHWTGLVESLFWGLILVALAVWLVWRLWQARDPLLAALALLPFLVAVDNLATGQIISTGGFPGGYALPNWRIGWYFGLPQAAMIVWPALFFLFRQRWVRWLGLLLWATPLAVMNLVASAQYRYLALLWTLPIVLVLAGWAVDFYASAGNAHRRRTQVP